MLSANISGIQNPHDPLPEVDFSKYLTGLDREELKSCQANLKVNRFQKLERVSLFATFFDIKVSREIINE